jgi:epoxyqueuosine reductase
MPSVLAQHELTHALRQRASELGFALVGVCPAVAPPGASKLDEWLARGYAGDMHYLADRKDAYAHPRHVLDGACSIVMLALPYDSAKAAPIAAGQGAVARYAWGDADYHDVIRVRLHNLADYLRGLVPAAAARGVVDTAPLLEREFAQLAGLGWVGKNTLLLNRNVGSYFFLAALLTDQTLDYDAPHAADHCGTCTACLDACPTAAFPQPYVLDASRCISYLTIEHKAAIPNELRAGIGNWLFGCDICQEVCPWNQKKVPGTFSAPEEKVPGTLSVPHSPFPNPHSPDIRPRPNAHPVDLAALFDLTEADFRARFRHTPLWRPHRRGLLRNAAIVLGNQRHAAAIPALTKGLADEEPLVREACAWALEQIEAHLQPLRSPLLDGER